MSLSYVSGPDNESKVDMTSEVENFTVIHLSTGHLGGAGLAARRLNAALNDSGISSRFFALQREDFFAQLNEFKFHRNVFVRFLSYFISSLQKKLSPKIFFSLFSLNTIPRKFQKEIRSVEKPILHVHNWYNLLNLGQLRRLAKLGIPIILTLHDQRIMTGGCHYSFECTGFASTCKNCPNISQKINKFPAIVHRRASKKLENLNQNLTFIAPSKWMQNQARTSKLLQGFDIRFIPNVFYQQENSDFIVTSPKALKVMQKNTVFGIASMDPKSFVKGGDIISALIEEVNSRKLPYEFAFLNTYSQDQLGLNKFWNSIDFLLVFSRAENSPNVIHEAKHFGVPVIATRTGGITELLHPEFDLGVAAAQLTPSETLNIIEDFIAGNSSNKNIRLMKEQYENYAGSALISHINLYQELIPK
jgi:glycosyltransferase involved in cell wall biosynthesis